MLIIKLFKCRIDWFFFLVEGFWFLRGKIIKEFFFKEILFKFLFFLGKYMLVILFLFLFKKYIKVLKLGRGYKVYYY